MTIKFCWLAMIINMLKRGRRHHTFGGQDSFQIFSIANRKSSFSFINSLLTNLMAWTNLSLYLWASTVLHQQQLIVLNYIRELWKSGSAKKSLKFMTFFKCAKALLIPSFQLIDALIDVIVISKAENEAKLKKPSEAPSFIRNPL